MKTLRCLPIALSLICGPLFADQNIAGNVTITGGASTGNLTVTGVLDSEGNVVTFGTQGTAFGAALLYQDNSTDTFTFSANRNLASWLWQHSIGIAAMRLDSAHQLVLYQADGTTAGVTLAPATNSIKLGSHVNGTLTADANGVITAGGGFSVAGGITNTNGTLTGGATGLTLNAGGTNQNITLNSSGGDLIFSTNSAERMRIKSTGNVGIGTANPGGKLHVRSGDLVKESLFGYDGTSDNLIKYMANGDPTNGNVNRWIGFDATITAGSASSNKMFLRVYRGAAAQDQPPLTAMTIQGDGSVGIGTTSPSAKLDVEGNVRVGTGSISSWGDLYLSTNSGWGSGAFPTIGSVGGTTGSLIMLHNPHVPFRTDNAAPGNSGRAGIRAAINTSASTWWDFGLAGDFFHIYRNGTGELLRVTNTGNVGIGTSTPSAHLHIASPAYVSGAGPVVRLSNSHSSDALTFDAYANNTPGGYAGEGIGGGVRILMNPVGGYYGMIGTNNSSRFHIITNATPRVTVSGSGNVGIGTTSPTYSLDVSGAMRAGGGVLNTANYFEKILPIPYFANGAPNQAVDIRLGNLSFWGYIDVEITSTYSYQNSVGKLTKRFAVGTNPSGSIYTNEARVADAMGTIPDNIAIGDFTWDAANSTYKIPVSHIVSTGNSYTVKVCMFTHSGLAAPVFNALAISPVYTLAPLARNYVNFNGNVGIGTTNPTHKLAVKGTIRAEEVIVDTGWADYVFEEDYRLAPLAEVEEHIKAKKHLPGIPSAAEVAEHGVSMGDMQSKLLSKVEELTLHLIAQEKEIAVLKTQNANFQEQLAHLQATQP